MTDPTLVKILLGVQFSIIISLVAYVWNQHRKQEKHANKQLSDAITKLSNTLDKMNFEFWEAINEQREKYNGLSKALGEQQTKCNERSKHYPVSN